MAATQGYLFSLHALSVVLLFLFYYFEALHICLFREQGECVGNPIRRAGGVSCYSG